MPKASSRRVGIIPTQTDLASMIWDMILYI